MSHATLIPNVKITDEYGATFPAAMIVILSVNLNDSWSISATDIDEEYTEKGGVDGGCYRVVYYCSPEARNQGVPLKPLRTFEDGVFSDVMIVDTDAAEITQLLESPAHKRDKAQAIVRKDLELRFR